MNETLTQRLQRAVALRDAATKPDLRPRWDIARPDDAGLSLSRSEAARALRDTAPSIVQLAVELGAEVERLRADAERYRWLNERMKLTPFPKDGWGDHSQRGAVYLSFRNNSIRLEFGHSTFLPDSIDKAISWAIENPGVPDEAANAAIDAMTKDDPNAQ